MISLKSSFVALCIISLSSDGCFSNFKREQESTVVVDSSKRGINPKIFEDAVSEVKRQQDDINKIVGYMRAMDTTLLATSLEINKFLEEKASLRKSQAPAAAKIDVKEEEKK